MGHYCTNCGKQLSESDKFCSNCGQRVGDTPDTGQIETSSTNGRQTGSQSNLSVKASNFLVPILVMFGGGTIGGYIIEMFMPNESAVHIGTIVYLILSGLYILSCVSSLNNKHSKSAATRSVIVVLSGVVVLFLSFFTYATNNISLAFILFFVALGAMIVDSILVSTSPDYD